MKNILFVYKEEYPWDIRVEKIVNTLKGQHRVTLLARNNDDRRDSEQADGYLIKRLPYFRFLPRTINRVIQMSFWFNPLWIVLMVKMLRHMSVDVLIIRDLPLMPLAVILKKFFKMRVIFDMAECYPLMYESYAQFRQQSIGEKMLKSSYLAARAERFSLNRCDHVWVMIEESRDRLLEMGLNGEKISIVSNTPLLPANLVRKIHHGCELRIAYVGFLTPLRGLDYLIEAIGVFVNHPLGGSDIRLDIVGKGESKAELQLLVDQLGLSRYIFIHGWLDNDAVHRILDAANVGTLTYRICSHWNNTIPNKLFDYMLNGLPVMATEVKPIKRILGETGAGITSVPDSSALADVLIELKSAALRNAMGEKGMLAVQNRYNWNYEERVLNETVERW
ncbi:MAG: glycosyltransferase family 4 protein [Gammaproteobacteria bacterium]|nr:glycosyltransferase family 4 protein [Gammaproteobacteria bacterium]